MIGRSAQPPRSPRHATVVALASAALVLSTLGDARAARAQPLPFPPVPEPTATDTPGPGVRIDPLADTPFRGERLSKLVLATPGVARDDSRGAEGKLYVTVNAGAKKPLVGGRHGVGRGYVAFDAITAGHTSDGDWLLAIPVRADEGGAFVVLVYRSAGGPATFVSTLDAQDGGLEVAFHDGSLFASAPVYAKNDDRCCPSRKSVSRLTYNAVSGGLVEVSSQTVEVTRPVGSSPSPERR
jgi:hypothetical protein